MQTRSRRRFFLVCSLSILLAVWVTASVAGTTGKLTGRVIERASNEGLPGVNVVILGTTLGAATNVAGEYIILNVPPGIYSVKASLIGYGEMTLKDVRISIDLTTRADFTLAEETLQLGEEVEVVAQRELIQKDLTATTAIVSDKNIQSLPVTEVSEVISLQAGVVEKDGLHIRGGRKGEVAYWIDGVPVTDAYDGGTVVDVNKDLVQELQVISGAFNAEYGQALSGIVNIATKEGATQFGGALTTYFGDYVSGHDKLDWGRFPAPYTAQAHTPAPLFRDIKNINPTAIRNFEGSLYGPLLGDKLSFNLAARYIYFDGWLRGQRIYKPENIGYLDSTGTFIPSRDPSGLGDGAYVPMNWNRKIYGQGKWTYRFRPTMKLTLTSIYDDVDYQDFDRDFILNPDGNVHRFRTGLTNILKLTHTISNRTFYDLAVSYTEKEFREYAYADPHDHRYVHPQLLNQLLFSFKTGGVSNRHFNRRTATGLVKFDLTSQMTSIHQFKSGVEYRRHRVFFEDIYLQPALEQSDFDPARDSPFIRTRIPDLSTPDHNRSTHRPVEFAAYLQDKIELQNFIVNVGVRLDHFDPDGRVLADPSDPNIYNPIRPENRFRDLNGNGVQDAGEPALTVAERRQYWYKKASRKTKGSPRLGVSFPVLAGGVFHFSFGQFFQVPKFERLYQNSDFKIGSGTGNQGLIGNADLEPEQTTNYEIGLKQEINDNSTIEVTAFFRDIRDLTSTRADNIEVFGGAATYNKFVNADFGLVRGVILSYNRRFAGGFSANADYTFQIAKASNSDPEAARNAVNSGALPEVQLTPVDWDQRHTFNLSTAYNGSSWGAGLIVQAASAQPYTPRRVVDISALSTNSERKPGSLNVDLRLYKDFRLAGVNCSLFARVFNLFDTLNEVNVFDDTGQADFTTDRNLAIRTVGTRTPVNTIDEWFTHPTFFSEPRRVEIGTTITF
ncbi:MAG: TonB-dependent receptor [candidate division KSB1 bacterium]|nr:TonB-dependent receptor [candidate division KSB1 bacterium]